MLTNVNWFSARCVR